MICDVGSRKTLKARDSAAMRCPSRQITASEIAGASLPAAMARARSASTSPSAPSATCASVSGLPGLSNSAGDFAILLTPCPCCGSRAAGGTARCRNFAGTGSIPFTQAKICWSGTSSQRSSSSSSASLSDANCASAKRPSTRSISRMPRCQQRKSSRRRRASSPSLDRFVPVVTTCLQRQKPGRGRAGFI